MQIRTNVMITLASLFASICLLSSFGNSIPDTNTVRPAADDELIDLINNKNYLLVLFYGDKCEKECQEIIKELGRVADTTFISDLEILSNEGHVVAESYGVTKYPALIYYRNGYPILYPTPLVEGDNLVVWMEQSRSVNTKDLTDQNFEHDTQASTGATTGDWFVMFYGKRCYSLTATWEALASELKHRMNVAKVDMAKSPALSSRFNIQKCPTLILFRAGTMYFYDLPDKDYHSLLSFANGWYKNAKSEKVIPEPTPFDQLTQSVADGIKERLDGPHGMYYVVGGTLLVFFIILGLILYCTMDRPGREKYD